MILSSSSCPSASTPLAYIYFFCEKPPPQYLEYLEKTGSKHVWKPQYLMFNKLILQCGYANVYTRFTFKYLEEFRKYERISRESEIGLWGEIEGLKQANF